MKNQFKIFCGSVALVVAGQVCADTTWTLATNYGTISPGVTVAGYANTGGADNATSAANNGALQTIQSATWVNSYGGITNADAGGTSVNDQSEGVSPEHAIDNNQRYDMALLSFASSVKLTQVKLGWWSGDSDITVMAYTGASPFTLAGNLTGKTYDQLIGLGWVSVGNYANVGSTDPKATGASVYSSYWLIGAYNPLAAGTKEGWSIGNDNIKLASVTGEVCTGGSGPGCTPPGKVPEPGSMALFGIALLGLFGVSKRRKV